MNKESFLHNLKAPLSNRFFGSEKVYPRFDYKTWNICLYFEKKLIASLFKIIQ